MEAPLDILKDPRFEALMHDFLAQAEAAFRRRANKANLHLTGAMVESFKKGSVQDGENFLKGHVEMLGYVRLKDMKGMSYQHFLPSDVLEKFVDKVGVENFAYVPGYEKPGAKLPSKEVQAKRIVFGIQAYRKKHPDVRRKYQSIYNDPISKNIVPRLSYEMLQLANKVAADGVVDFLTAE